jgi:hypothetical protein
MPGDCTLVSLDASHAIPMRVLHFQDSRLRRLTPVRLVLLTGQTGTHRSERSDPPEHRLRFSCLGFVDQPRNQWFSGEPLETLRARCSLRQSPLMTRLPRSPGSTLVLRLNQQTVHDFILLFTPPCGSHLTPLATGSLGRSLLVFSTLEASPATTFHACSSPAPTQSGCNLHLLYLDKNQSTQRGQSLITQGSDHPPVLEPHMVLSYQWRRRSDASSSYPWRSRGPPASIAEGVSQPEQSHLANPYRRRRSLLPFEGQRASEA